MGSKAEMALHRREFGVAALAVGAAALVHPKLGFADGPVVHALKDIEGDAMAELAYVLGLEAYVYGFPLVMMDVTNAALTAVPTAGEYNAPINQFLRMRGYVSPDFKTVVRVSVNSLWSGAVLDLDKEPLVASYPDCGERYFVMQLMNMWTDDFGSLGTRTGRRGFLIAGPNWNGTVPTEIRDVYRCTTRGAWLLVQMSAAGPQDFPAIHKLQDELLLTPLSAWGKPYAPAAMVPVDPTVDTTVTPYDLVRLMTGEMFFRRLAGLLRNNPPYAADGSMMEKLKRIGVEPGKSFDADAIDPAILQGLNRVPAVVWEKFANAPYQIPTVNGWINPLNLGRYGTDYNTRALIAWFGLGALTSDDAVYPSAMVDGDGQVLDGAKKYILRFEKDHLPPSETAVWSVSPYRENFYVRNTINRYGILSGMPLKYGSDGSLEIYIQKDSPGPEKEANWLPCPPSDPFNLTLRVYQPKKSLLDGTYKIPPVRRVT